MKPLGVAVDATHVYFNSFDYFTSELGKLPSIERCPLDGCGSDEPEVVKSGSFSPFNMAVNDARLFYTNVNEGTVVSLAKPK